MFAADRAHVPLWDFMARPTVWRELYRTAMIAERRAEREVAERTARLRRMQRLTSGGR